MNSFLNSWLAEIRTLVRPKTYATYAGVAARHLRTLGAIDPAIIGPNDLKAAVATARAAGVATATQRLVYVVAKLALEHAGQWPRILAADPRGLKPPKVVRRRRPVWGADDARRFVASVAGDPLEALYILMLTTALRQGELLALEWSDIDVAHGTLAVQRTLVEVDSVFGGTDSPKSAAGYRSVALPPLALAALVRHRARRLAAGLAAHPRVFTNRDGGPLYRTNVRRAFAAAIARAGVPAIRFHDVRHTSATLMLAQGAPVKVVQERLGHSTSKITLDTYAHVIPGMDASAAAALGASLG